jgi:calcineurin-like phosphoesterase family protein
VNWFISDTHLNHANIIKYCNRPFADTKEMDANIIDNINAVVKPEDTLWHLGDVAFVHKNPDAGFNALKAYRDRIACRNIHIMLGNHDNEDLMFELGNQRVFKSVQHYYELRYAKKTPPIVMMHYPMAVWNKCHRGAIHLFGHSHGTHTKWREENMPNSLSVDVGVDCHNYRPLSLDEILAYMEPRAKIQREAMDHHS